jgi:hypothetical protein
MEDTNGIVEKLIRESLADPRLSEVELERIDEIYRSADRAAKTIRVSPGTSGDPYASALPREFENCLTRIRRIRERAAMRCESEAGCVIT